MFAFGSRGSTGQDAATVGLYLDNSQFLAELHETDREWIQSMQGMTRESLKLELAEKRLANSLRIYGEGSAQAKRALVNLSEAQQQVRRTAEEANSATKKQQRTIIDSIKWFGLYSAGIGVIYGVGRAITSSIQKAGEYQRSLNILGIVTGATADQMKRAAAEATALGRDTQLPATSAKDAAEAMTTLAKSGFDVEQAMQGARGVLQLAAAASIDSGSAADIAAKAIKAYGLGAGDIDRVADAFANVANASLGEIPDFSLALSQSSAVAKDWNLSLEDTVATLGIFANNAITGSDAGTSLRVMLTRLAPISTAAAKEMDKLNLSAFDGTGQIKPYRQILQEYHDVLVKLTPAEQKHAIQVIFGQDAQRAAGKAILQTILNYDKMLQKVQEVGGAQKFATGINQGYTGSLDAFKSSVETLQIAIGTALLPELTNGLKAATAWVNGMEESGAATVETRKAVEDITTVVHGFVGAVKVAHSVLGPLVESVGGLENATKAALGIWLLIRLRAIAAGLGLIRTRAFGAAVGFNAMAAAEERAGAAGAGGLLGGKGPGRFAVGFNGPTLVAAAVLASAGDSYQPGAYSPSKNPHVAKLLAKIQAGGALTAKERSALAQFGGKSISQLTNSELARLDSLLGRSPGSIVAPGEGALRPSTGPALEDVRTGRTGGTGGRGGGGDGLTQLQRLQLAGDQAQLTTTLSDDLKVGRALVAYYKKVASNESLKGDALFKARQDVNSALQAVQSIEDQIASDRQQAAEKAASKREAARKKLASAREAAAKARKRDVDAVRKALDTRVGPYANTSQGFAGGRPAGSNAYGSTSSKSAADGPDFGKLAFEFLQNLHGLGNQFGSNFAGAVDVNGRIQTHLMRENNEHLNAIRSSQRNPEARYSRYEADTAMAGDAY